MMWIFGLIYGVSVLGVLIGMAMIPRYKRSGMEPIYVFAWIPGVNSILLLGGLTYYIVEFLSKRIHGE